MSIFNPVFKYSTLTSLCLGCKQWQKLMHSCPGGGYSLCDGWYICAAVLTPFFHFGRIEHDLFGVLFLIHQQQSYLLGYKNYQFLQKSIFLAPNSIFSSIFLGPIFSGQRHTPIRFQAEYPPRDSCITGNDHNLIIQELSYFSKIICINLTLRYQYIWQTYTINKVSATRNNHQGINCYFFFSRVNVTSVRHARMNSKVWTCSLVKWLILWHDQWYLSQNKRHSVNIYIANELHNIPIYFNTIFVGETLLK